MSSPNAFRDFTYTLDTFDGSAVHNCTTEKVVGQPSEMFSRDNRASAESAIVAAPAKSSLAHQADNYHSAEMFLGELIHNRMLSHMKAGIQNQSDKDGIPGNLNEQENIEVNTEEENEQSHQNKTDPEIRITETCVTKQEPLSDDEKVNSNVNSEDREDTSGSSTLLEDSDEVECVVARKNRTKRKWKKSNTTARNSKDKGDSPDRKLNNRIEKEVATAGCKPKKQVFQCNVCYKVVQSKRALLKHVNLHTGEFKCTECEKVFNSEKSLQNHGKVHAGFVGSEKCNVCDKIFYDKSSLNKHTLSVHMGIKNFQCEHCNLAFFAKKTYAEHVRVHTGERPFKCDVCPKTYKRISDLNHHKRLHKGEVSHTCEICGDGFRRTSELKRHMKTKHINMEYDSDEPSWKTANCTSVKDLNRPIISYQNDTIPAQTSSRGSYQNNEEDNISSVQGLRTTFSKFDNKHDTTVLKTSIKIEPGTTEESSGLDLTSKGPSYSEIIETILQQTADEEPVDMSKTTELDTGEVNAGNLYHNGSVSRTDVPVDGVKREELSQLVEDAVKACFDGAADNESDRFKSELDTTASFACIEKGHQNDTEGDNNEDMDNAPEDDRSDDYGGDTDVDDLQHNVTNLDMKFLEGKPLGDELDIQVKEEANADGEGEASDLIQYGSKRITAASSTRKRNRKASLPKKRIKKKKLSDVQADTEEELNDSEYVQDKKLGDKQTNTKKKSKKKNLQCTKASKINELAVDGNVDVDTLTCLQCNKVFSSIFSLKKHAHLHKGTFSCNICGKCFITRRSLETHIDNHEGRKVSAAVCNVCEKAFYDASSLNKHVQTVHMNFKPLPCPLCDRRFAEKKTLKEHIRVHTGERPFACEICGKTFKRNSELNFHIRKHKGETTIECPDCGAGFMRHGQLKRHMTLKHSPDNPFKCFLCLKGFPAKIMLKHHQAESHTRERKHICEKCGSRFYTVGKLKKHLRRKTDCIENPIAVGGFLCKFCPQYFENMTERKKHMEATHSQERDLKHSCEVCSKLFSRTQALKIHMKIHLQKRDYTCSQCGSAFIQKHHLKQHMATHTGDKQYECPVCQRKFAQNATLYNHMKHH